MTPIIGQSVIRTPVDDDSPRQPDPREDDRASAQSRRYLRDLIESEASYDNHSR